MKTSTSLFVMAVALLILQSCQKDTVKKSTKNTSLIVGRWMVTQKHTRIYDIDNNLLKDTMIIYGEGAGKVAPFFETYDVSGNAYVTGKPYTIAGGGEKADTTSFMKYTIEGSHLTLKPSIGGSQTKPILQLDEVDMNLESTYNAFPPGVRWGLDMETTYLFRDEVMYTRK